MSVYESLIKVRPSDDQATRERDIGEGLRHTAVILIDEYGWTPEQVSVVLDDAFQDAEDEWGRLHPVGDES